MRPPAATSVFPTALPDGNDLGTFRSGPVVHDCVAGSKLRVVAPAVGARSKTYLDCPSGEFWLNGVP
jgi:hypothetical protein